MKKWVKFAKRKGACEKLLQVVWKYSDGVVTRLYLEDYWIGYLPPEFHELAETQFKKVWLKTHRNFLKEEHLTCVTFCITPNGMRNDHWLSVPGISEYMESVVREIEEREHARFKAEMSK